MPSFWVQSVALHGEHHVRADCVMNAETCRCARRRTTRLIQRVTATMGVGASLPNPTSRIGRQRRESAALDACRQLAEATWEGPFIPHTTISRHDYAIVPDLAHRHSFRTGSALHGRHHLCAIGGRPRLSGAFGPSPLPKWGLLERSAARAKGAIE